MIAEMIAPKSIVFILHLFNGICRQREPELHKDLEDSAEEPRQVLFRKRNGYMM